MGEIRNSGLGTFTKVDVRFLGMRGSGVVGKWLFEVMATPVAHITKPSTRRFVVEFQPEQFRHSRLAIAGLRPGEEKIALPSDLCDRFNGVVREAAQERRVDLRGKVQTPANLAESLMNLVVLGDFSPAECEQNKIQNIVLGYFNNPGFVRPDSKGGYFARDPELGKFFITETPCRVG